MDSDTLLVAAAAAGLAGVGVLRLAWARKARSHAANLAGWGLMLGGAALGWAAAGAWGTTVAALFPMLGAMGLLAIAGSRSHPSKLKASNRRAGMLPERGEPKRILGRLLTFVLVGLVAGLLGIGIATAVGGILLLAGAGEANAYASALFGMPIAWGLIAFALLMQPRRSGQAKVLALFSVPVWPTIAVGLLT